MHWMWTDGRTDLEYVTMWKCQLRQCYRKKWNNTLSELSQHWVSVSTCNIVIACLSPVLVQMGAIPSFTATKPTRRLPVKRRRMEHSFPTSWQRRWRGGGGGGGDGDDGVKGSQSKHHSSEWPTFCPLVPQPRFILERVEFVLRLPSVLLRHTLPHELLVVLR